MASDCHWFLHEVNDGFDNGYWRIKYHTQDELPEVGELLWVVNSVGGWHHYTLAENDEIIWSTWSEVERKYYTNNRRADYGWIDKEGVFYGCGYMGHADCADACFNLSELEAEQAGYVKIYKDPILAKYDEVRTRPDGKCWYCAQPLTKAQKETLAERGFKYPDD